MSILPISNGGESIRVRWCRNFLPESRKRVKINLSFIFNEAGYHVEKVSEGNCLIFRLYYKDGFKVNVYER